MLRLNIVIMYIVGEYIGKVKAEHNIDNDRSNVTCVMVL